LKIDTGDLNEHREATPMTLDSTTRSRLSQSSFLKWCLIQEARRSSRENQPTIWWVVERTGRSNRRHESVAHSSLDGGASVARRPREEKRCIHPGPEIQQSSGRVDVVHGGIPKYDHYGVREGWVKYYWKPWEELSSRKSVGTARYC